MKNKILILLVFCHLSYAYGKDNSTPQQNSTVTMCKYTGGVTGALIGGIAGYILRKKMAYFTWFCLGLNPHKATNAQVTAAAMGDGLIETVCELGGLMAGYASGDKIGTMFGTWLTN